MIYWLNNLKEGVVVTEFIGLIMLNTCIVLVTTPNSFAYNVRFGVVKPVNPISTSSSKSYKE